MKKINFHSAQVMASCWDIEPRDRPKFKHLVTSLEALRCDHNEVDDGEEDEDADYFVPDYN